MTIRNRDRFFKFALEFAIILVDKEIWILIIC